MTWATRRELLARGMSVRQIAAAVHAGALIRVRRGIYCSPDERDDLQRAVRVGGRLACVSELRRRGIWVLDDDRVHVRVPANAARLRSPDDRRIRRSAGDRAIVHWRDPRSGSASSSQHDSVLDALSDAASCLERRSFVASLDSAMRLGLISGPGLALLRSTLPASRAGLVLLGDRRAESGLESIVRVLVVELGLRVEPQVPFPGIGRVDLLVEGCVVVETDGAAFHDHTVAPRDRRRDAAVTAMGYGVLRFGYSQVVFELESVALAVLGAVAAHRRVRNSGRIVARARSRMQGMRFS